jgi:hypothetical protein
MFKKLILAVAALAVSAPALADRGHGPKHRHVVVHKPVHVVHRPVHVYRPVHVHRPAPVVHHYYHRPAPAPRPVVVYQHSHVNPMAVFAGALIGAAIVHHAVTGY